MMRYLLPIFFVFISSFAICQNKKIDTAKLIDTNARPVKTITIIQRPAQFPGGIPAWQNYLIENLDRDVAKRKKAPNGKYTVYVTFIIDEEGRVTNVQAENDPGYGTKEEAIRIISNSPKWLPATQNEKKVIYRHKQGISFVVTQ